MKSLFETGFRNNFRGPNLGQWGEILSFGAGLLKTGVDYYQASEAQKSAEKARKKAQAAADAAAAELKKQQDLQAQAIAAEKIEAATGGEKILGIPRDAAIWGGVGLVTIIGLIAILK